MSKESSNETLSKVSKREQFSELHKSKKNLADYIKENKKILSEIQKAEQLDQKLGEHAKQLNRHLNDLKEEFSSYFDEESGNNTTKESLEDIKEYIKDELKSLNTELDQVSSDLDNMVLDSKNSKRSLEDQDSNQPYNKRPRNNNDSSTSGSYSLPPSLPSAPSSGSSPSSSDTLSKVVDDGGSVYKSSEEDYEFNYYTLVILDFIIFILNALGGDDGDKD